MNNLKLRTNFINNNTSHGTFCYIKDPAVVEMIGWSGYDFVILDLEHSSLDMRDIEHMTRAAEASGVSPIVRISHNDKSSYLRVAEMGVSGVMISQVKTASQAEELVKSIKFPPKGQRGMSGSLRAAKYSEIPMKDHMKNTNEDILAIVMIEGKEAINNLEEILSVEGLDAIFIGPSDLSREYGVPGEPDHPKVLNVIKNIFEITKKYPNIKVGIPSFKIESFSQRIDLGADFITCPPADTSLLYNTLKNYLEEIKENYK